MGLSGSDPPKWRFADKFRAWSAREPWCGILQAAKDLYFDDEERKKHQESIRELAASLDLETKDAMEQLLESVNKPDDHCK